MFNKKVISTLLLSLIFAVIIALVTDNKMDDENYKALFVHKVFTTEKYNLVIAGDSRIYRGVSAEIIGKKLKLKALNLGFSSGGHSKLLFDLIDTHLDKKSPNKIIILGITPVSLTDRAANNGHIKRVLNRKKEEVLEYEYLFPVKLFFAPTTPYKIRKKLSNKKYNDYRQEFHINDGWIASWYDSPIPYRALKSYKNQFTKTTVNKQLIQNLYKKVSEWKAEGITIYGFYPPSSANMNELEKNLSGFDNKKFINGFLNAGGCWINIEKHYFSFDGSHLEKESAIRLSNEIADKILRNDIIKTYNPDIKINDIYRPVNYAYAEEINSLKKIKLFDTGEQKITLFKEDLKQAKQKNIKKITVETSVLYKDSITGAKLACKIKNSKAEINTDYSTLPNRRCKLYLTLNFSENYSKNDSLEIFLKNPGNREFYIDSLKIYYISK